MRQEGKLDKDWSVARGGLSSLKAPGTASASAFQGSRVSRGLHCTALTAQTRTTQVVHGSADDTFNFIMSEPVFKVECTFSRVVEKLDAHTDIIHVGLMPVVVLGWVTRPRDLCLMRFWCVRLGLVCA